MSVPPIWFLDIDGVINSVGMPCASDGVDPADYRLVNVATTEGIVWPIQYSPAVVDFVNEVSRAGLVDVRWLTTWQQDARLCFAPIVGLDEFPAFDDPEEVQSPMSFWKGQIVMDDYLTNPRSFIWTDDDIDDEDLEFFAAQTGEPARIVISPISRPGLTPGHLDEIRQFLESAPAAAQDRQDGPEEGRSSE